MKLCHIAFIVLGFFLGSVTHAHPHDEGTKFVVPEWWASVYAKDHEATHGALICTFHIDNMPNKARCSFVNIRREVIDQFTLVSQIRPVRESDFASIPENTTVGFIGDQGIGDDPRSVLELMKEHNVDLIAHAGDLGYDELDPSSPFRWNNQLSSVFGEKFPYLVSIGNHDKKYWSSYEHVLLERTALADLYVRGRYGVEMVSQFNGLTFFVSGIGTVPLDIEDHLRSMQSVFRDSEYDSLWRICLWHKNHRLMQIGGKNTEVPFSMYDACRKEGALIVTGHEHSYARSHLFGSVRNQEVLDSSDSMMLKKGTTIVVQQGLGGRSVRDMHITEGDLL